MPAKTSSVLTMSLSAAQPTNSTHLGYTDIFTAPPSPALPMKHDTSYTNTMYCRGGNYHYFTRILRLLRHVGLQTCATTRAPLLCLHSRHRYIRGLNSLRQLHNARMYMHCLNSADSDAGVFFVITTPFHACLPYSDCPPSTNQLHQICSFHLRTRLHYSSWSQLLPIGHSLVRPLGGDSESIKPVPQLALPGSTTCCALVWQNNALVSRRCSLLHGYSVFWPRHALICVRPPIVLIKSHCC
jgi:hypothetical protein